MKAFIILAIVAVANAGHLGGIAVANTGSSVSSRAEDGHGNYKFGYNEQHLSGGSSRSEVGNPWGVVGSYSLNDADGRVRIVNYVADGHGFRAHIKTNEPGTAPQPAAATSISAPIAAQKHIGVVGHAAAPLVAHASYAAPVVAKVAAPLAYGHGYGYGHAALAAPALAYGAYGHGAYGHGAYGHGGYGHLGHRALVAAPVLAHGYAGHAGYGHGYGHY